MAVEIEIVGATPTTTTGEVMALLIMEMANVMVSIVEGYKKHNRPLSVKELIFETNKEVNESLREYVEGYCKEHNIPIN